VQPALLARSQRRAQLHALINAQRAHLKLVVQFVYYAKLVTTLTLKVLEVAKSAGSFGLLRRGQRIVI
jgi:hypothetical protein